MVQDKQKKTIKKERKNFLLYYISAESI